MSESQDKSHICKVCKEEFPHKLALKKHKKH